MLERLRPVLASCTYCPALRSCSFMAAVAIKASKRAAGVQALVAVGCDNDASRHFSRVWRLTPSSAATFASTALSGGCDRATALSLNACPYRANLFFHHRPRFHSMGATCILTRGDNGSTLKPTTTALAMLQWLGVKPS